MRVTLFHNPSAGNGQTTEKDLLAACKLAGLEATYFSSKADDLKKALDKRADLVVAVGGDGTVSEVACELLLRKIPLAIVPLGTANNIARSLGIAGTVHELAESWGKRHFQTLDIGLAYGSWGSRKFVEAVGVGPFARVIGNNGVSEKKQGAARLRQGRKELRQAFNKAEARRYRLALDGREVAGRFVAIEITNIAYTGPGLQMSPKSAPGDALLNVICVRSADRGKFIDWLEAPHEAPQPLRVKRGCKVSFQWEDEPLRIDDNALPAPKEAEPVNVELAGAIDVVVPEKKIDVRKTNGNGKKRGSDRG